MRLRLFLSLIFLFNFLSCRSSPIYNYKHIKVVKAVDGDTVILENGEYLRYIGIDTPETRKKVGHSWIEAPQPFALEAKDFNRRLVEGKFVRVEFDVEKRDRYKRLLGYVFVDGTFVNRVLLEEGLAVLYTRPPNVKYVDKFLSAQKKARFQRKGLWGAYEIIRPQQAHRFIGQIRTVRGRVLSCMCTSRACFLNFGPDYRTDFTVVIFRSSFPYFHQAGINICSRYSQRVIEVSGRIREYNGPEIVVNIPEEITLAEDD